MPRWLEYGPVICTQGPHKGRIGYFDDVDTDCSLCKKKCCSRTCNSECECEDCPKYATDHGKCPHFAIIYWGDALFCSSYSLVPIEYCTDLIPMKKIIDRIGELRNSIFGIRMENKRKAMLLEELEYAQSLFYEKHILSLFLNKGSEGKHLFISHSSKDKGFANCLYADLIESGHQPWLDERDIKAGQSIPSEIQKGLANADYTLVLLSPHSVKSNWVSAEWESSFWDEIESRKTKVIPLLIETCDIPPFLKNKKYIDFREDYQLGLNSLLKSL